jgi:glutamyl-tRNA synthetase
MRDDLQDARAGLASSSEWVTRFAPSPTGDLHLGGALVALASYLLGDRCILRIEDIDTPRVVKGSRERIEADLAWLGFAWCANKSEAQGKLQGASLASRIASARMVQSERFGLYEAALRTLEQLGLTYPCDCSRAEIAQIASAPHAGDDVVYPGNCRNQDPGRPLKRAPSIRLRVPERTIIGFRDAGSGDGIVSQHVDRDVGDFVLRRGDGVFSYQLAVAYDDATMGVTHVVRGRDLLASTPRQLLLMRLLGLRAPSIYVHLPLVMDGAGERLAKRSQGACVRALRESGVAAEAVLGALACGLGVVDRDEPVSLAELKAQFAPHSEIAWSRTSWKIPERFAHT